MKKIAAIVLVAFGTALSGCGSSVPKVDDPHNIVVDGKPMTQGEFVEKYCSGKTDEETCVKVRRAAFADSSRDKNGTPRF